MKYLLMFFVCSTPDNYSFAPSCEWRSAVTFSKEYDCMRVIQGYSPNFVLGKSKYLMAGCFSKGS